MKPNSRLSVNQLIDYGIRLVQESQPDAARPFFEKALEREPRNTAALLWLAGLSETSAEGYRLLVQTLEIDPSNERARTAIRWNYWREQGEKMRAAQQASGVAPADRVGDNPKKDTTPAWLGLLAALIVIGGAIASIYFGQPLPVSATVAQTNVATQEVAQTGAKRDATAIGHADLAADLDAFGNGDIAAHPGSHRHTHAASH